MFEIFEKVLRWLYAPPWEVAFNEWERMSENFSED